MKIKIKKTGLILFMLLLSASRGLSQEAQREVPDKWGLTPTEWLYLTGPDLRNALRMPSTTGLLLEAARAGDANAMAAISGAYAVGVGVTKNSEESLRWARASSATGLGLGHFVLALKHFYGDGLPKNTTEYIALLRRGSDAGHLRSATELASVYLSGTLTSANLTEAARFAHIAAIGGDPKGQFAYGGLHYVPGSPVYGSGLEYFEAAATKGHQIAANYVKALKLQLLLSEEMQRLEIVSIGNGLVGAELLNVHVVNPCQSVFKAYRNRDNAIGGFLIDWTQTKATSPLPWTIYLTGAIRDDSEKIHNRMVHGLYREQHDNEDERDRLYMIRYWAQQLCELCQQTIN